MTQASAGVEITAVSSGSVSNNETPDKHAAVEELEANDTGVSHTTPDINTENILTVDLQSHDVISNGDMSDMQDFTPDDYATLDEAMNAAVNVHTTLNTETETMMSVDDLRNFNYSLGGAISDSQDMDLNMTDTWHRHGSMSTTAMQARPISIPMSITVHRGQEWDTGDLLGDDL